MQRVMLVEDEMLVRLGLKNSIEWDRFDMALVADVSNGYAALEIYEKEKPDLIITDLKMPEMSGMELIEKIREKDRETGIIILSCLEEFDLVRKAMSLGVMDYILKLTMTEEEIEAVLRKAQSDFKKKHKDNTNKHTFDINKDDMKEKLLKNLLFYNLCSDNEFEAHVDRLKLQLNPVRLQLCVMEIDNFHNLKEKFNDEKGQLIKLSMLNVLNELLQNGKRGEAFYDNDSHYILVFSFNDLRSKQVIQQELSNILNNIKSVLGTFFDISISFGISSIQTGYYSLKNMYKDALKVFEHKFILGTGVSNVSKKNRISSKEIAEAVMYIEKNYASDITLQKVAEHVNLSPAYLSCLFKKEMQVNFVEYLNEFRVEKAKCLLLDTYLKSYDVAEKVGFTEDTYFSKVFKKNTGESPNEFRRRRLKELSDEVECENN